MQPLNRDDFAAALKKGLGRAWLHVAHYGLDDDVADLVLEACLHNQNYDVQTNSIRAVWLFEMFHETSYSSTFRRAILRAFKTEDTTWDVEQLCGLIKEMAIHGDEEARQMLRNYAFNTASQCDAVNSLGADEWIELTGIDGVIDLARIYGQRLITNPNDRPSAYLGWTDGTKPLYQTALLQQAQTDQAIATYYKYLKECEAFRLSGTVDREMIKQQTRQRIREQSPLNRMLKEATAGVGEFPGHYATFGRYATPEELEIVYTALLTATDDAARMRLLWIFRRAQLPQLDNIVFNWAIGDNDKLRKAAIAALVQNTDERVHNLAKAKAATGHLTGADSEALDLFLNNYQDEDAQLIASALIEIHPATDWEAHSLSWSPIDLAKRHDDPNLVAALRWAYENTPCTNCRYEIVKLLNKFQAFDDTLLQECLHDAEEDTRALAQQCLEQQQN